MTRHERFDMPHISKKDFVLATDLDGTFLGGTQEERARFYAWLNDNRERIGLIFVTGRDPGFIRELVKSGDVPCPDYVVADVGTTIARIEPNYHVAPIAELEEPIEQAWQNTALKVTSALLGVKGLTPQTGVFRYRASFDMDPVALDRARAVSLVEELGLDALISDERFFDVLPKGVSKGPSLERLIAYLDIAPERVLVAGDTLNDLSMLALGVPAVAVGQSETALIEAVADMAHVHRAEGAGVAGIAEAILAHGLFRAEGPSKAEQKEASHVV